MRALLAGPDGKLRCFWATSAPEYLPYHDGEWGFPTADDVRLFEKVARFGARDVARLLADPGIVRHRGKIESTIHNARRACELKDELGSLAAYFWRFEPDPTARPRQLSLASLRRMTKTPESVALSKDLKKRGWTFVGPTTIYAFMQAVGIVDDHLDGCAFRARAERARRSFERP